MKRYLLLYTVGPVQSYIEQASRLYDLQSGSRILSKTTEKAMKLIKEMNSENEIIFPHKEEACDSENISYPNRCIAIIYDEETSISDSLYRLDQQVRLFLIGESKDSLCESTEFKAGVKKYFSGNRSEITEQLDEHFHTYYTAIPYQEGEDYSKKTTELEQSLASVKNFREFKPMSRVITGTKKEHNKCIICGERKALFKNDTNEYHNRLREGEQLCAVCYQKRCLKRGEIEEFPASEDIAKVYYKLLNKANFETAKTFINYHYYATICFDGDSMGKWIGGTFLKKDRMKEGQKKLTEVLGNYANWVKEAITIGDNNPDNYLQGVVIYAGGEDLLAMIPLQYLFKVMETLREQFRQIVSEPMKEYMNKENEITFSMGVMISHIKCPLQLVLRKSREMEKAAKEYRDEKNAVSICMMKRSGDYILAAFPWTTEVSAKTIYTTSVLDSIVACFKEDKEALNFIRKLHYEFDVILKKNKENTDEFYDMICGEMKRLLNRSVESKAITEETMNELLIQLHMLLGALENREDSFSEFINLLYVCEFLRRNQDDYKNKAD